MDAEKGTGHLGTHILRRRASKKVTQKDALKKQGCLDISFTEL